MDSNKKGFMLYIFIIGALLAVMVITSFLSHNKISDQQSEIDQLTLAAIKEVKEECHPVKISMLMFDPTINDSRIVTQEGHLLCSVGRFRIPTLIEDTKNNQ